MQNASDQNPTPFSKRLWEIPELTQINRLPMHSGTFPLAPDASSLWQISLNGDWAFSLFHSPEDVPDDAFATNTSDNHWTTMKVPGNWTMQNLWDKPQYTNVRMPYENIPPLVPDENPTGVYRTRFTLPEGWTDRRIVLHFGSVENYFEVYVNGSFVGMSKDNRLPSEFDLSDVLTEGENLLAVKVQKWCDANYIEDQDQWWQAGIIRDVFLYATDQAYVEDLFARTDFDPDSQEGELDLCIKMGMSLDFLPEGPDTPFSVRAILQSPNGAPAWEGHQEVLPSFRLSGYEVTLKTRISDCAPWSAEHPHLYRLQVELTDAQGSRIDTRSLRIGFKRVEVGNRELRINGKVVMIRGVNRHDHDEKTGRVISRESMIRDIRLMKQFNFNAVRSAHYPNDPLWYELCDEYGLYVLDEANLETHANYSTLARNPRWRQQFIARGTRMVLRDRNHACIFGWSLGNEAGNGENHDAMYRAMKALDDSRIYHHEGELHPTWMQKNWTSGSPRSRINQFVNPMYPDVDSVRKWAEQTDEDRPMILCEYSHAMGNSSGNLKEYWDLFYSMHGLQGGFIWEWVDHGILQTDKQGRPYWAYGGDFGEKTHDSNFCADGLVAPDRSPHPAMFEFKKLAQPIHIEAIDAGAGRFRVKNRMHFTPLDRYQGRWEWQVDGKTTAEGTLPVLTTPAEETEEITLALPSANSADGAEIHLILRFTETADTPWCQAGHEVAWEQFEIKREHLSVHPPESDGSVELEEKDGITTLRAGDTSIRIDLPTGKILQIAHRDKVILNGAPQLCMWRATTDNDGIRGWTGQDHKPMGQWMNEGFHDFQTLERNLELSPSPGKIEMRLHSVHAGEGSDKTILHNQVLTLFADGTIQVGNTVDADADLPTLPRIGVTLETAPGFEELEWFGRGPRENHIDRNAGSPIGHYTGTVDEQFHNYIMPQENGNKTDVRWFTLRNEASILRVQAHPTFEFSVRHFTDNDLFSSRHINELEDKRRQETIIHIDHIQRGVGTGSCGPQTLPRYCVNPGRYEFTYTLQLL